MRNITITMLFLLALMTCAYAEIEYISPTGVSQRLISKHLYEVQQNNLNHFTTSPGLVAATEAVSVANAATYLKDGVFGTAVSGLVTMSGDTVAVSCTQLYGFEYNTTTSTTEVLTGTVNVTDPEEIKWTVTKVPVGYVKVVTDATHEFVPGTTSFAGAGITSTFYNYGFKPTKIKVLNESR